MNASKFTSYALLGSGRVARHFQTYLKSLNLPVRFWSRNGDPEFNSFALHGFEQAVEGCSHVLLAVSDRALGELAARCPAGKTLVHFSGAARVDGVHAAHPLMTFTPEARPLEWYRQIPFVIDPGVEFSALLPGLENPHFALAPEKRPLYHALASLAGNSTYLLWRKAGDEFENALGLPRALLAPFLHQVVDNAFATGDGRFTGPVARGDWQTVGAHLNALESGPLAESYRDFLKLAGRSGHVIPKELS